MTAVIVFDDAFSREQVLSLIPAIGDGNPVILSSQESTTFTIGALNRLRRRPRITIVITSRKYLGLSGDVSALSVHLEPLLHDDALALLSRIAPSLSTEDAEGIAR